MSDANTQALRDMLAELRALREDAQAMRSDIAELREIAAIAALRADRISRVMGRAEGVVVSSEDLIRPVVLGSVADSFVAGIPAAVREMNRREEERTKGQL